MAALPHEHGLFLFLDGRCRPVGAVTVSQGQRDHVTLPVNGVLATGQGLGASAMIVIHNHPSGVFHASEEDVAATAILMRRAKQRGIILLDHWLVAGGRSRSILGAARQYAPSAGAKLT
jgi:DNA repair protein RadC